MEQRRCVGIDLGKRTYEIKFIASNGNVTGTNGKTSPSGHRKNMESGHHDIDKYHRKTR